MIVIKIISSPKGGGAELLVRELHKHYLLQGVETHSFFLAGKPTGLETNEKIIGTNPRNLLNIFKIRRILKGFLQKSESDLIIHAHLTWPFFYVALASIGLKNLKLVYTEHNTTNKRRRIPLWRYFERLVYARYSRIICISPGVYESLASWVGPRLEKRMVTIPNGSRIYSMVVRPPLGEGKPRLISVGSLTIKKNFSTALRAVAKIKDQIDSYTIIGEGPERQRLEQLIRDYDLLDIVNLVGWSDSIETYFQASDIQVIPSLWEGFGLVAVEGMSTGISVVASSVDGLRDVLGQNNPAVTFVDHVQDEQAWAVSLKNSIEKIRADGEGEQAVASRKQAEKFTLNAMAESYLNVYNCL